MAGRDGFTVTPRRGRADRVRQARRPLVDHVMLPVPTEKTKGVLIAPTVFGNVMLGPTAEDIQDKTETASPPSTAWRRLRAQGRRLMPALLAHEVTAVYAGLRAATEHGDYQLARRRRAALRVRRRGPLHRPDRVDGDRRVDRGRLGRGAGAARAAEGLPAITHAEHRRGFPRPYADADRIAPDPAYGEIVCFCERVTRGEIRDAVRSPIPPLDLDGLRRRTRVLMGRCQGFYCGAEVAGALLADGGERDERPPSVGCRRAATWRSWSGPARPGWRPPRSCGAAAPDGGRARARAAGRRHPAPRAHHGFGLRDLHRASAGPRTPSRCATRRSKPAPRCERQTKVTGWLAGRRAAS